jgi:hypothetical protein
MNGSRCKLQLMERRKIFNCGLVAALAAAALLAVVTPALPQTVTFTIDANAQVKPISRFIYGINDTIGGVHSNLTARRIGGNRWTAYNWENNASNAGSDYIFQNDSYLGGGNTPGGAVIPAINNASAHNAGLLLTIPIQGYVAADKRGDGDVRNSGPNYLKTRFHKERAAKGSAFTLTPDRNDKFVYQDEFVNWVKTQYPYGQSDPMRPIWFCLDNEPDLWAETHLEVHPDAPTYAEMITKSTAFTKAIKAVAPDALIFGPVSYGWTGYVRLQNAPDANNRDFLSFYLKQMKAASTTAGKRLLDVLDLHWYPEATGGGVRITENDISAAVVAARLQAPRSLWDKSYVEDSWIAQDYLGGAIYLLPRMTTKIANGYPGTRLAFTEYNYGAGGDISGGIAQADVLGIFGRYGVFAAMQWPLRGGETYVAGAFKMYRDFDGNKASFGDISVKATTSSVADTSVYASLDSTIATHMVIVAINKTDHAISGAFTIKHKPMTDGAAYTLTSASATPAANGNVTVADGKFNYTLPAYSVSTLALGAP